MPKRREDNPGRSRSYEAPGFVDQPFDRDRPVGDEAAIPSDAACTVPWVQDGFQAVQVFVDPVMIDLAAEICALVEAISADTQKVDQLSERLISYGREQGWSFSIYEDPRDDISQGVVAVAVTPG